MAKRKIYPAKVGTHGSQGVILRRKPVLNKMMEFKTLERHAKWQTGIIDKINPDGFIFIQLF